MIYLTERKENFSRKRNFIFNENKTVVYLVTIKLPNQIGTSLKLCLILIFPQKPFIEVNESKKKVFFVSKAK